MVDVRVKVRGGVTVRRVVATADVAALHTHAQVNPLTADAETIFASVSRRRDVGRGIEMGTRIGHDHLLQLRPVGAVYG